MKFTGIAVLSYVIAVSLAAAIVACALLVPTHGHAADALQPFPVDVWEPPFNQQRQHVRKQYVFSAHAAKPWQLRLDPASERRLLARRQLRTDRGSEATWGASECV